MTDDKVDAEGTDARGNDWEVVSLTASAYAAAPSSKDMVTHDINKDREVNKDDSANAMFMSDHFMVPPFKHENLFIGSDSSKLYAEPCVDDCLDSIISETNLTSEKDEGLTKYAKNNLETGKFSETSNLHGTEWIGMRGVEPIEKIMQLEEEMELERINFVTEEANTGKAVKSGYGLGAETSLTSEIYEHSPSPSPNSPKHMDLNNKIAKAVHPFKSWWKRHAKLLYSHAKESNSIWSVAVVAALMGVVILGRRWQRDRWQIQPLKLHFSANDEIMSHMVRPFTKFKHVLVGGSRREILQGGASVEL